MASRFDFSSPIPSFPKATALRNRITQRYAHEKLDGWRIAFVSRQRPNAGVSVSAFTRSFEDISEIIPEKFRAWLEAFPDTVVYAEAKNPGQSAVKPRAGCELSLIAVPYFCGDDYRSSRLVDIFGSFPDDIGVSIATVLAIRPEGSTRIVFPASSEAAIGEAGREARRLLREGPAGASGDGRERPEAVGGIPERSEMPGSLLGALAAAERRAAAVEEASMRLWQAATATATGLPGEASASPWSRGSGGGERSRLPLVNRRCWIFAESVPELTRDCPIATWLEFAKLNNSEGWIFKDTHFPGGSNSWPSSDWEKLKECRTATLRIVGVTPGKGKYDRQIGAVVVADRFGQEVAKVGGMSDAVREEISRRWPNLDCRLVEVSYQGIGAGFRLRHPRFERFRFDKTEADALEVEPIRAKESGRNPRRKK